MAKKHSKLRRQLPQLEDGTIQIQLTKGYITLVDPIDADLAEFNWYAVVGSTGTVYAARNTATGKYNQTRLHMHRILLSRMLERDLLPEEQVDHKNGDGMDNHRSNLRLADKFTNNRNQGLQKNNKSGVIGVSWLPDASRWHALIFLNGKNKNLGYYVDLEDARVARRSAEDEYYGEFAPHLYRK